MYIKKASRTQGVCPAERNIFCGLKTEVGFSSRIAIFGCVREVELAENCRRKQPFGVPVCEDIVRSAMMLLGGEAPPYVSALIRVVSAIDQNVGVGICLRTVRRLLAHISIDIERRADLL